MDEYRSLSHTKWTCKYHVVFIPKYRRKVLYCKLRKELGAVFHELARHFLGKARNYTGQSLWARGFFVSTAGVNDEIIREYISHQEEDDSRIEQLELFQQKSSPYEDVNEPQ